LFGTPGRNRIELNRDCALGFVLSRSLDPDCAHPVKGRGCLVRKRSWFLCMICSKNRYPLFPIML
jgi:hypothetical protein